jgi:hypothetical protein
MDVTFIPQFNITVTPEDINHYYKQQGIVDYPKHSNGLANLSLNKNACKDIYQKKHQTILQKYCNVIDEQREKKKKELITILELNDDCPICLDPISIGRTILNCSHVFCVQCSIQHFRIQSNCPLCRAQVCKAP